MEIWVENGGGVRQGDGPITTATAWTATDRQNAAGEWSFSLPALDPRAALLRTPYFVRAWQFEEPGDWREVGYGRITSQSLSISPQGTPLLTVSGVNELGLLADRICHNMSLRREVQIHPSELKYWTGSIEYLMDEAHDRGLDDSTTYYDLNTKFAPNYWLIVRSYSVFHKIKFVLHAGSGLQYPVLTATYYDTEQADWATLAIDDGTASNGFSLKQSGIMTFEPPATWGVAPGSVLYEIRLQMSDSLWSVEMADVSLFYADGTPDALATVIDYAPGWSLDTANGYGGTAQRPFGANLITNGDFETFTGTADDATTDTFAGWTNNGIGAGNLVEASTTAHGGTTGCKITRDNTATSISRTQAVTQTLQYTLKFWARGDGAGGHIRCIVSDATSGGTTQEIIYQDATSLTTDWAESITEFTVPVGVTNLKIEFSIPNYPSLPATAYVDDVSLQEGGGESVYLQLRDETVLEALRRIAANTAENFIRSPAGKQVLWLGEDVRDSGLRALAAEPGAGASDPDVLLLTALTEVTDASGLVSRVYAYGGGMGAARVTLAAVTQPLPPGYVLNRTESYLERTAAVTALGIIETAQQWPDIMPADQGATQAQYAANALMWQAWQYLETHSATDTDPVYGDVPRFYRAQVVKAERMVLPGYLLRLSYRQYRDGLPLINIERDCWITAVTRTVSDNGVQLTGLELATVPRAAENDNLLLARNLIRLRDAVSHNTAEGY